MVRWTPLDQGKRCKVRIRRSFQFNILRWELGERFLHSAEHHSLRRFPLRSGAQLHHCLVRCFHVWRPSNCMAWWATCKGTVIHDQARFCGVENPDFAGWNLNSTQNSDSTSLTPFCLISESYTRQLLHKPNFTPTSFYASTLLHQALFPEGHSPPHHQLLHKPIFTNPLFLRPPFTPTSSFNNELLHTPASTQTNF